MIDREPQPSDGPDYHADHQAWRERQRRPVNPVDDPEFYCHGQKCIEQGCSPLLCKDEP